MGSPKKSTRDKPISFVQKELSASVPAPLPADCGLTYKIAKRFMTTIRGAEKLISFSLHIAVLIREIIRFNAPASRLSY